MVKTGISAIGKLFIVAALAGAFVVGMISVVYMSLRGEEIVIPEIVGKDFAQSEKELEALGLKVKKVRSIYSKEKPNTILEQRPRAGETGKTGLMISVYVAEPNPDGQEAPATIVKDEEEVETTADLEIPSDKKKANKNSNVKRATTTRDVTSSKSNSNTASNSFVGNANGNSSKAINSSTAPAVTKPTPTAPTNKPTPGGTPKTSNTPKPTAAKSPVTGGDVRSRRVN